MCGKMLNCNGNILNLNYVRIIFIFGGYHLMNFLKRKLLAAVVSSAFSLAVFSGFLPDQINVTVIHFQDEVIDSNTTILSPDSFNEYEYEYK